MQSECPRAAGGVGGGRERGIQRPEVWGWELFWVAPKGHCESKLLGSGPASAPSGPLRGRGLGWGS